MIFGALVVAEYSRQSRVSSRCTPHVWRWQYAANGSTSLFFCKERDQNFQGRLLSNRQRYLVDELWFAINSILVRLLKLSFKWTLFDGINNNSSF